MTHLHFPWLEAAILCPLLGVFWIDRLRDPFIARKWSLILTGLACVFTVGGWEDFALSAAKDADDNVHFLRYLFGREIFVVDQLSSPLIPLIALLYFLTTLTTLRTKIRRFSFGLMLVSETLTLALFSCKEPWLIILLLSLGTLPAYFELRNRNQPTRAYVLHMATFVVCLVLGEFFVMWEGTGEVHSLGALIPLLIAVFIRSGMVPVHCWLTDLFERATFGTALLTAAPIAGAYAALRLVVPIAPDWVLRSIGLVSLITAIYASGMALVQRDVRRFYCYLFLSHSALVLVGLELVTPIGLTGGLCVWLSVGLSLGGFGLTLRAIESRHGRLNLDAYQGLYEHMPPLAFCYMLSGLASVGFPGTLGFVGTELLVDGVVAVYPSIGVAVVLTTAMNGIAVIHSYFVLFTGTRHISTVSLEIRERERIAVLALAGLILLGGVIPQANIASRHAAAFELLTQRAAQTGEKPPVEEDLHEDEHPQIDHPHEAASQSEGDTHKTEPDKDKSEHKPETTTEHLKPKD